MPLVRCPNCGRVSDGVSCFACGYDWPAPPADLVPVFALASPSSFPTATPVDSAREQGAPPSVPQPAENMLHDSADEMGDLFAVTDPSRTPMVTEPTGSADDEFAEFLKDVPVIAAFDDTPPAPTLPPLAPPPLTPPTVPTREGEEDRTRPVDLAALAGAMDSSLPELPPSLGLDVGAYDDLQPSPGLPKSPTRELVSHLAANPPALSERVGRLAELLEKEGRLGDAALLYEAQAAFVARRQ